MDDNINNPLAPEMPGASGNSRRVRRLTATAVVALGVTAGGLTGGLVIGHATPSAASP